MAKARLVDLTSGEQKEIDLPDSLFGERIVPHVMHQALVRQLANARQGTASTKTRAMVSGGGRKPYRQKGTGRARHGSIREPNMVGGGVVFGPHPRSYRQRMPKKMRRLALRSALSVKAQEGRVVVVRGLSIDRPSTKQIKNLLEQVGVGKTALVVLEGRDFGVEKSAANLENVKCILASNLNIRDLLKYESLVIREPAIDNMMVFAK